MNRSREDTSPAPSSAATPVTARAAASVGNLNCGFDVLGMALEGPADRVTARPTSGSRVRISAIHGSGEIPDEPSRNSASAAVLALLEAHGLRRGVELELHKGIPLSGGMGGSAASAVASVVAVDRLFGLGSSNPSLLEAALEGERTASGSPAADNVAAALVGGIVLARPWARRPLTSLPVPPELTVALLHPGTRLDTRQGRALIPEAVPLTDAVEQWGDTGALVHALHSGDWELLGDAMVDRVAEPARTPNIPALVELRGAALDAGAVACGISGSGPSVFALCRGRPVAEQVGRAMVRALKLHAGTDGRLYISGVAEGGARVEAEPTHPEREA